MGAFSKEIFLWLRPVVVYVAGVVIYSFLIAGDLVGVPGEFSSVRVESGYKVTCHFTLKNKGFLSIKSEKIQLNIPKETSISDIDIPDQYKYMYRMIDGGKNKNFVIFLVEGMKGRKSLDGTVSFFQNKKWEMDYINPLSFSD